MPLPVGPGDEYDPALRLQEALIRLELATEEPELLEVLQQHLRVEDADDDLLAERHGQRAHAQLGLLALAVGLDAPVLRLAALGDVEPRERFDARHHRVVNGARHRIERVQHAVDAQPNVPFVALRLDVNVARPLRERVVQQVLDRVDDVLVVRLDILDRL